MRVFLLLITCIHLSHSVFFSRRRRAPQPVPVDCSLSEWETIESCTKQCGPDGVEEQERRIIVEGRNGGKSCSEYELERTVSCNRVCYNEALLDEENSNCVCSAQWTGECCDEDVNECETDVSLCAEICINEAGTYRCDCPDSYTLDTDDTSCVDMAECQISPPPCQHRCRELAGGYECYCEQGYSLADDNTSCDDVNECETGSICEYTCVNIPGDYECECRSGYYRNSDNKTCTDIDECSTLNGGCKQICDNTVGGYRCSCTEGYQLASNAIDCIDVDECEVSGSLLCDQFCVNILGSYECRCEHPYVLSADLSSCSCQSTDEAECEAAREKVEEQSQGFDKDSMYNWIIGILIIVCLVLMGLLGVMCVRKGYHRLYPPKPPPISTIPRYNNTAFRNDIDSNSGSGIYDEPDHYAVLGDTSPDYMDMSDRKSKAIEDEDYMQADEQQFAENPYENGPGSSKDVSRPEQPEYAPNYVGSNVTQDGGHSAEDKECGYSARLDHDESGGFAHEDDYENNPAMYDNI